MIDILVSLALLGSVSIEKQAEVVLAEEEPKTVEELCAQYFELSAELSAGYQAVQEAARKADEDKDLMPEIKANSDYAKTRIAFRKVVNELGDRACPVDMDNDFPPLID